MYIADQRKKDLESHVNNPGPDAFVDLQVDVWVVLTTECLPRFLKCDLFLNFLDNKPDSPRTARRRVKLEDFFGEEVKGSLTKVEVVKLIRVKAYEKNAKRRAKRLRSLANESTAGGATLRSFTENTVMRSPRVKKSHR